MGARRMPALKRLTAAADNTDPSVEDDARGGLEVKAHLSTRQPREQGQ